MTVPELLVVLALEGLFAVLMVLWVLAEHGDEPVDWEDYG